MIILINTKLMLNNRPRSILSSLCFINPIFLSWVVRCFKYAVDKKTKVKYQTKWLAKWHLQKRCEVDSSMALHKWHTLFVWIIFLNKSFSIYTMENLHKEFFDFWHKWSVPWIAFSKYFQQAIVSCKRYCRSHLNTIRNLDQEKACS